MIKLSVIIPAYNGSEYLPRCLDSMINQTLKEIEIIVVDDGSTDNTKEVVNNYIKKDQRISYFYKENGGQATARNLGFKHSTGEFVAFIDCDDYLDTNMFETMYKQAKSKKNDIVLCSYYITYPDHEDKYNGDKYQDENNITCSEYIRFTPSPWNKIYRKDFLTKNNFAFPEGRIYEDYTAIPHLAKFNPKISYIDKPFVHYVQTDNSTMRTKEYSRKFEDIFIANEWLHNEFKNTAYTKDIEFLIVYYALNFSAQYFYRYEKYHFIDRLSDFIKKNYPHWNRNPYIKNYSRKEKLLMFLFYHKKYRTIKFFQQVKRLIK